jgi:hypothetical protein
MADQPGAAGPLSASQRAKTGPAIMPQLAGGKLKSAVSRLHAAMTVRFGVVFTQASLSTHGACLCLSRNSSPSPKSPTLSA